MSFAPTFFQCIPTPLAWWAHQLPDWFLKLGVVATFIYEIPVPLMFFSPVRSQRVFAFYTQVSAYLFPVASFTSQWVLPSFVYSFHVMSLFPLLPFFLSLFEVFVNVFPCYFLLPSLLHSFHRCLKGNRG